MDGWIYPWRYDPSMDPWIEQWIHRFINWGTMHESIDGSMDPSIYPWRNNAWIHRMVCQGGYKIHYATWSRHSAYQLTLLTKSKLFLDTECWDLSAPQERP